MIKLYIKQAWQLLKQNRFYSSLYILATGLSITMVMILAIILYVRVANIYPETNRGRMLIVGNAQTKHKDNNGQYFLSLDVVNQCLYSLQTAEAVTAIYHAGDEDFVQPDNSAEQIPVSVKYVDTGFWDVFAFAFSDGKPFTEADMESGIRTVVISESFSRRLFGTTESTGKHFSLNYDEYRICGVVKDPSYITERTFANIWMPYTAYKHYEPIWEHGLFSRTLGPFKCYVIAKSTRDVGNVKEEILSNINRFASSLGDDVTFTISGQPDSQLKSIFRMGNGQDVDMSKIGMQYAFIFLILLLIPAVSLSGMADSQMERRISEIGVRRAFGAPQKTLLSQLITENMLFTFLGGLFGLLLSYTLIYLFRRWIISIGTIMIYSNMTPENIDVALSPSMLMNYQVFTIALLVCLLLNLMVTVIPAWRASRCEIVYSLNNK